MNHLGKEITMIKDYFRSVLMGTGVLFVLFGIATSIQYSLLIFGVGVGIGGVGWKIMGVVASLWWLALPCLSLRHHDTASQPPPASPRREKHHGSKKLRQSRLVLRACLRPSSKAL